MDRFTQITIWSEKVITWVFTPCGIAMFGLYFMGFEDLMLLPLAGLAAGSVALFVLYVWRLFV